MLYAPIYGMVGLPWDAQALLDSVLQQKDLSPFWRKKAYSIYYDSYGIYRLNLLPRELSDQRLHEVRVVEDSLKVIGQDAVRAAFTFDRSSANVPYMIAILQDKLKKEIGKNKAVTALLNNELRILAFMKLGVADGSRISTILGISVNTLYFYRNRLKRSAVSRDSFENDVMAL